jgi:hypothetical protein
LQCENDVINGPYNGVNNVSVQLTCDNTRDSLCALPADVSVLTKNGPVSINGKVYLRDGLFRIDNVPNGYYTLCLSPIRNDFYCVNGSASVTNTTAGATSQCKSLQVNNANSAGHRFALLTSVASPTPTIIPGQPTNTPTPTATRTPTPSPTATGNPGSNTPTPTRVSGANPSPTEIVLVTSVTPGVTSAPQSATVAPTIPVVGNPLPAIAIIAPLLLVALAFLL